MQSNCTQLLDIPDEILSSIISGSSSAAKCVCHHLRSIVNENIESATVHSVSSDSICRAISARPHLTSLSVPYLNTAIWETLVRTCASLQSLTVRRTRRENALPFDPSEYGARWKLSTCNSLRYLEIFAMESRFFGCMPNLESLSVHLLRNAPHKEELILPFPAVHECRNITSLTVSSTYESPPLAQFVSERLTSLHTVAVDTDSLSASLLAKLLPHVRHFSIPSVPTSFYTNPTTLVSYLAGNDKLQSVTIGRYSSWSDLVELGVNEKMTTLSFVGDPGDLDLTYFPNVTHLSDRVSHRTYTSGMESLLKLTSLSLRHLPDNLRILPTLKTLTTVTLCAPVVDAKLMEDLCSLPCLADLCLQPVNSFAVTAIPTVQSTSIKKLELSSVNTSILMGSQNLSLIAGCFPNLEHLTLLWNDPFASVRFLYQCSQLRELTTRDWPLEMDLLPRACPLLESFHLKERRTVQHEDAAKYFKVLALLPHLRNLSLRSLVIRSDPLHRLLAALPLHSLKLHSCYITPEALTILGSRAVYLRSLSLSGCFYDDSDLDLALCRLATHCLTSMYRNVPVSEVGYRHGGALLAEREVTPLGKWSFAEVVDESEWVHRVPFKSVFESVSSAKSIFYNMK